MSEAPLCSRNCRSFPNSVEQMSSSGERECQATSHSRMVIFGRSMSTQDGPEAWQSSPLTCGCRALWGRGGPRLEGFEVSL